MSLLIPLDNLVSLVLGDISLQVSFDFVDTLAS